MVQAAKQQEASWERLLVEVGESAPGTFLQEGEVLSRGDSAEAPVPMRVSDLRYKGYVTVWDTITGAESIQPWWLLWQTMRKAREDGSKVFTRTNPHIPPDHGEDMFCPLNPAAPAAERFSGKGFKACKKQHIPHWDGLQRHIQKSHGRAWKAMERERQDRERNEDRELQRLALSSQREFMDALLRNAAGASVPPAAAEPASDPAPAREVRMATKPCEICGEMMQGNGGFGVLAALKVHMKTVHATGE